MIVSKSHKLQYGRYLNPSLRNLFIKKLCFFGRNDSKNHDPNYKQATMAVRQERILFFKTKKISQDSKNG